MMNRGMAAAGVVWLALFAVACGERAGLPETETTGTTQAPSQTTPASATTTASMGGSITNMVPADKEFLVNAASSGLFEVEAANLALQQASSADVNGYAQRMITDHGSANRELQELATAKGVGLPAELTGDHRSAIERLSSLTGPEFDRAYMQQMLEAHQRDTAEFERASVTAQDADVRAFAQKTLPVLKEHFAAARETLAKL